MDGIEEFADLVDETLHDARNIASKSELEMQVSFILLTYMFIVSPNFYCNCFDCTG